MVLILVEIKNYKYYPYEKEQQKGRHNAVRLNNTENTSCAAGGSILNPKASTSRNAETDNWESFCFTYLSNVPASTNAISYMAYK